MTAITRSFFIRAIEETSFWETLPDGAQRAFGIYIVCDGEATHCCSLTPSSWCEWLQNYFSCAPDDTDKLNAALNDDGAWETESGESGYFNFARHDPANPWHGPLVEFEVEADDDYDDGSPLPDYLHQALWDDAREYFSGNSHIPKACWHALAEKEIAA